MAEKRTVELEIKDNSKSLKSQYKEAVVELQKLSAQYGESSTQAINAAKAAAALKDQIEDVNDAIQAQKGEGAFIAMGKSISAVASGFSAVEGAMGLVGAQSEDVQQAMLRVQSAMALAQGLEGLEDAGRAFKQLGAVVKSTTVFTAAYNFVMGISNKETATNIGLTEADAVAKTGLGATTVGLTAATGGASVAMKLFRLALISTGFGAIIVLVGLLVANFDSIVGVVKKVVGWFGGLSGTMKNVLSVIFPFIGMIRLVVAGLEALGVVENEAEKRQRLIDEATIKRHHKRMDEIAKEKALREKLHKTMEEAYNNQDKAAAREIALLKAQGKDTTALERARLQATINYQANLQNESAAIFNQNKEKHELTKAELYAIGVRANDWKEYNKYLASYTSRQKDLLADNKAANEARKDAVNQLAIFEIEVNKRNAESQSNYNQSSIDSGNKTAQTQIDITRRLEDESLRIKDEGRQKELDALDLQYKRKEEDAKTEFKNDIDKVSKLAKLNAQAVISKKIDEKKINDKYDKLDKEAAAKALEDKIKLQDEQWYALQKVKNSQQEQELLDLGIAYDKEYELAETNAELQKALTDKFNKDNAAINKKYRTEEKIAKAEADQKEAERIKELNDLRLNAAKDTLQVISNLTDLFAGKSKTQQKKAFQIQKAVSIAGATIDTYKAANAAFASGSAINPIFGAISAAAAITAGLLNVKKIASQKFEGGGDSGSGASGGGGGGVGGSITPQFNTVGNNGINQLAQLQQQPTMAYVVSGQVTSQQALDRNRVQNSSF